MEGSRFIVITEGASIELENAITATLNASGDGFWHYIKPAWLINTNAHTTAKGLTTWLRATVPGFAASRHLVIAFNTELDDYWGSLPDTYWKWFYDSWGLPRG